MNEFIAYCITCIVGMGMLFWSLRRIDRWASDDYKNGYKKGFKKKCKKCFKMKKLMWGEDR